MSIHSDRGVVMVAPSDLTYLVTDCLRCFWEKSIRGVRRPAGPFPSVFRSMDRDQRNHYDGRDTSAVHEALPPGSLSCAELRVTSTPLTLPGRKTPIAFRGALDAVIRFREGGFGVVDFKTTVPRSDHADFYGVQLAAYAYALEHPASNSPHLAPVRLLGLLCFEPKGLLVLDDGDVALRTTPTWIEVERNDDQFMDFLSMVTEILDWTDPPKPGSKCAHCKAYGRAA